MKRVLAFILSLIVFTGSVYPCCLEDDCHDEPTAVSSQQKYPEERGGCSPFFACATCPGFVHLERSISIPQPFIPGMAHFETPVKFFSSSYHSTLFQPPRNIEHTA
jgi:hypothetical protein